MDFDIKIAFRERVTCRVYHILKKCRTGCFRLKPQTHTDQRIRSYGRTHLLWMFQHSISWYQRALRDPARRNSL